nr:Cullin-4 [Polyrhizophydium stewartii]
MHDLAGSGSGLAAARARTAGVPRIGSASGPARKLVIKSFKVKPKLPETFEDDTWDKLRRAVEAIHARRPVPDGLEELYKACENLCHHNKQGNLYRRLEAVLQEHVVAELATLKQNVGGDANALRVLDECWRSYCQQMILIRSIFLYLDRTYVLQTPSLRSLWTLSMDLFRDHVVQDSEIQRRLVEGIVHEIDRERRGEQVSRTLLHSLVRMMVDLGVYLRVFEAPFLETTRAFYRYVGQMHMSAVSAAGDGHAGAHRVSEYLVHVVQRLEQESVRCGSGEGYLDPVTRKRLIQVVEDELIRSCFDTLVAEQRVDDLARLFSLLERVGMLDELKRRLGEYIKARRARKTGAVMVRDPSRDKTMVADLLAFKAQLDRLLRHAFGGLESFDHAIKEAIGSFINQRQNKPSEMIAKYVDDLLRHVKGMTDAEVDAQLDQCLVLFRLIQGKDVFEAFYSKDLAKRLLLGKSASVDAEKSMLLKLKAECGGGFTTKLEGMFKDMDLSREFQRTLEDTANYRERIGPIDLTVFVLTANHWPTYPVVELNLPPELLRCQDVFRELYLLKHKGRRLVWQNSLGSCLLRAHFGGNAKELQVSLFQAVVLLSFNDRAVQTYSELQTQTGLEPKELVRTMQSLACSKTRVLSKGNPKVKEIGVDETFQVNEAFSAPQFRVKINSIQVKETVEEQEETNEKVFQDRVFQVDAAIVRIMKTEKRCTHAALVTKLFQMLRFPVATEDLKKRIESLMEREYMDRDPADRSMYVYVA